MRLTARPPACKISVALRESPSGKASAFQADIRGFESHLPLSTSVPVSCDEVSGYGHVTPEHLTLKPRARGAAVSAGNS